MRKLLIAAFILAAGCSQEAPDYRLKMSKSQGALDSMLRKYEEQVPKSANNITRQELRKSFLNSVHKFLLIDLNSRLSNYRVRLNSVGQIPLGDIVGFTAEFHDVTYDDRAWNAKYWMEFDYSINSQNKIKDNPSYIFLKNVPEKMDTTVSFFYAGKVEWDHIYSDRLKIKVVPFPKDFDFDNASEWEKSFMKSQK